MNIFRSMISERPTGNVVCSPLSMSTILSVILNGADGETANEISKALGVSGMSKEEINDCYKKLQKDLYNVDKSIKLNLANSIWFNNINLQKDFVNSCQDYYNAHVQSLDFSKPSSLETINNWSNQNTNGMIPKLLSSLSDDTKMILANAIYFQGKWGKSYFEEKNTVKREFHNYDNTVSMVNTMVSSHNKMMHYYSDELKVSRLSYGNGAYEFIIAMPEQGTLDEYLDYLEQNGGIESLQDIAQTPLSVDVYIPKYEISNDFEMTEHYKSIGIETLFDKNDACLPFIANVPLYASNSRHQVKFTLDEQGAKAAATSIHQLVESSPGGSVGPVYEPIHYDKPFVFCIMETSSKTALFLGKIEKFDF